MKNNILKYNQIMDDYSGVLIKRNGNVMNIKIDDKEYFYGVPSQQIRRKGEANWTKDIELVLKSDKIVE
jgi:hypothetical protein